MKITGYGLIFAGLLLSIIGIGGAIYFSHIAGDPILHRPLFYMLIWLAGALLCLSGALMVDNRSRVR